MGVERRGKFLLLPLDNTDEIVIHLGMTGQISPTRPPDHVRVRLDLDQGPEPTLYFRDTRRFGRFLVAPGGDHSSLPTLARMGPEPLSDDFDVEGFARALKSRSAIKPLLLSQRPVAGLGNIYIDEALWAARIHPSRPAQRVGRARVVDLHGAIVAILARAVARGGTTLNDYRTVSGEEGEFGEELSCYGRGGAPCHRCGTPLVRILLAQRGTCYCPQCQRR